MKHTVEEVLVKRAINISCVVFKVAVNTCFHTQRTVRIVFSPHYCAFTLLPLSYIFLSWQHLFHVVACTALLYESWMAELQPGFNWMHLCSVYWYMQYCVPPLKKIKIDAIFSVCDFLIRQSITYTPGWQSKLVFLRCGQKTPIWMSVLCPLCKFTIYLWSPRESPPVGYEST